MPPPGPEAQYLVGTVGHALAKGVAATVIAAPDDPVEYLAEWLERYVEAQWEQAACRQEKKALDEQQRQRQAQQLEVQREAVAAAEARSAAIAGLAAANGTPLALWQAAVELVRSYTSAAAVYVADIVDEERSDWAAPEGEPDEETDDEAGTPAGGAEEGGANGEEAGGGGGNGGGGSEEGGRDGEEAEGALGGGPATGASPARQPAPDYSTKLLRYVAASAGQEFMTRMELRRPHPAADDDAPGGGDVAGQTPVTFRLLDERMLLLEVPAVAMEPRVKFLRGFPRIGGYAAAAVPASDGGSAPGAYHAVLAADTLLPDGHGQALSQDDVGVLCSVAQALGAALDRAAAAARSDAARGGAAEALGAMAAALAELRKAAPAPAPVPEGGEEPAAAEDGEQDGDLAPAERIAQLEESLRRRQAAVAAGRVVVANARAALGLQQQLLAAIVQAIRGTRATAIRALKLSAAGPPATFAMLRAVLLLLGLPAAAVASWREVSAQLHLDTFAKLEELDATRAVDPALWSSVRAAYKTVRNPKDLERELPQSGLGAMLLAWLRQVRATGRRASALRDAEAHLAAAEAAQTAAERELLAARGAKAREDEAAAAAAEAAVAEVGEAAADQEEGREQEEDGGGA